MPPSRAERTLTALELEQLVYDNHTQTKMVAKLSSQLTNSILASELVTLDANGLATREYGAAFGSLAVASFGGALVVAAGSPGASAPGSGTAVSLVGAGMARVINMTGHALTLYGTPGTQVTLEVFTYPQPPAYGAAGSAGTAGGTGRVTNIVRYAAGQTAHGTHPIPAGRRSYSVLVYAAGSAASPTLDGVPLLTGTVVNFSDTAGLEAASLVTATGDDVLYTEVI